VHKFFPAQFHEFFMGKYAYDAWETRQGSGGHCGWLPVAKSRFYAAADCETVESRVLVATAKVSDAEMRPKIERHREDGTTECGRGRAAGVTEVLAEDERDSDVIVVDCLTVYAAKSAGRRRARMATRWSAGCRRCVMHFRGVTQGECEFQMRLGVEFIRCVSLGRRYRALPPPMLGESNQRVAGSPMTWC